MAFVTGALRLLTRSDCSFVHRFERNDSCRHSFREWWHIADPGARREALLIPYRACQYARKGNG